MARRRPTLVALAAVAALAAPVAGCGSMAAGELPPPAAPAREMAPPGPPGGEAGAATVPVLGGEAELVVEPQARELVLRDRASGDERDRIPAGVGPTLAASDGQRLAWVVDTGGDGLLVVRVGDDELEIERRVHLPGRPYGIARDEDRYRLWVNLTATNEVAELPAHGRPHVLARRPAGPARGAGS